AVAVMIPVPEISRPRPAAHLHRGLVARIPESAIALVSIQRVAHGMAPVQVTDALGPVGMKLRLLRDALTRGLPHARNINILAAFVVEIDPAATHASTHALDARLRGDVFERTVAVVAIKLRTSEVIGDEQIREAIASRVSPCARKTIPIVIHVESGSLGSFDECTVSLIAEEVIGGPVTRVVVGDRIVILFQSQVIHVEAEVNVEASVVVEVRDGGVGEGTLWGAGKLKGIALERERAVSIVEEQQRTGAANHKQVLPAAVQEIGKEGT